MTLVTKARAGLAFLCLLAAASAALRVYVYRHASEGWEGLGLPADLGNGVLLPRAYTRPLTIPISGCSKSASVNFVRVSPYESDSSLVGPLGPEDHVAYVYRGRNLGSRFITIKFNAIYFARRAYARLSMQEDPTVDELAVKIIAPGSCDASPDDVMAVLRHAASRLDRSSRLLEGDPPTAQVGAPAIELRRSSQVRPAW